MIETDEILAKANKGERLSFQEIEILLSSGGLCDIGHAANNARMEKADPKRVSYIKDRNINYTNICISGCRFCAFYKKPGHADGYVISRETLGQKIEEAMNLGGVQILLQGGLHPDLTLDFYTGMLRFIAREYGVHVHGFSPPEIIHIASIEGLSIRNVIQELIDAGLHSIPGGGAEVLSETARRRVSPNKCSASEWLKVMETAHELGLKTTATMMFGHKESIKEQVEHLVALRDLQDRTNGFTAFIPWCFQSGNTDLSEIDPLGGHAYLKMLATSRLALDNFINFQVSWVTQGANVAQAALFFGANDFGSTMIEENVVAAAGVAFRMSAEKIEALIRDAGFIPVERDQAYHLSLKDNKR